MCCVLNVNAVQLYMFKKVQDKQVAILTIPYDETIVSEKTKDLASKSWQNLYGCQHDFYTYRKCHNLEACEAMNCGILEESAYKGQICVESVTSMPEVEVLTEVQEMSSLEIDKVEHIYKKKPFWEKEDFLYLLRVDLYEATNLMSGSYAIHVKCGPQLS